MPTLGDLLLSIDMHPASVRTSHAPFGRTFSSLRSGSAVYKQLKLSSSTSLGNSTSDSDNFTRFINIDF